MRLFGLWLIGLALCAAPMGRAQDAATEQRLQQLSGTLQDLIDGQEKLRKRVESLAAEVEALREQQARPQTPAVSPDDLRRLHDSVKQAIQHVDAKRVEDIQKIRADLLRLMDAVKTAPAPAVRNPPGGPSRNGSKKGGAGASDGASSEREAGSERGFYYTVAEGDTLSAIITACREKNVKVTQAQILKANPGLNPDRISPGKKIFIPVPQPSGSAK